MFSSTVDHSMPFKIHFKKVMFMIQQDLDGGKFPMI